MNQISWSGAYKLGAKGLKDKLPVEITVDGEPMFVVCNKDDVIVTSDLHIRVRNMLRAMEKRARIGMPKPIVLEPPIN